MHEEIPSLYIHGMLHTMNEALNSIILTFVPALVMCRCMCLV